MADVTTRSPAMPRNRDNLRDFPGRRALNLALRAAHLAGVVLLGAALLGGSDPGAAIGLTLASGAGMLASDLWADPGHLREAAGLAVLVKLVPVAAMAFVPGWAVPLFWLTLVFSVLFAHAPGALRHRRLF